MANHLRSLLRDFGIAAATFDRLITEIPDDDSQVVQALWIRLMVALANSNVAAAENANLSDLAHGTLVTVQYRRGGAYFCTDVPADLLLALAMHKLPDGMLGRGMANGAFAGDAPTVQVPIAAAGPPVVPGTATATWYLPLAFADHRIQTADGEVSLHEIEAIRVRVPTGIAYNANTVATGYTLTVLAETRTTSSPVFGARPIVQTKTTIESPVSFQGNAYKLLIAQFNAADAGCQVTGTVNGRSTHQGTRLDEIASLGWPFGNFSNLNAATLHGYGADSIKDVATAASYQFAAVPANPITYVMESVEPTASSLPSRTRSTAELESVRANPLVRGGSVPWSMLHAGLIPGVAKSGTRGTTIARSRGRG